MKTFSLTFLVIMILGVGLCAQDQPPATIAPPADTTIGPEFTAPETVSDPMAQAIRDAWPKELGLLEGISYADAELGLYFTVDWDGLLRLCWERFLANPKITLGLHCWLRCSDVCNSVVKLYDTHPDLGAKISGANLIVILRNGDRKIMVVHRVRSTFSKKINGSILQESIFDGEVKK